MRTIVATVAVVAVLGGFALGGMFAFAPDTPIVVDDSALGFPAPPGGLKPDTYTLQAVMRRNPDSPSIGRGEGSAYSEKLSRELYGGSGRIELRIDRLVEPSPFGETERVKLVELKSELLSDFYGRDIIMKAAVTIGRNQA